MDITNYFKELISPRKLCEIQYCGPWSETAAMEAAVRGGAVSFPGEAAVLVRHLASQGFCLLSPPGLELALLLHELLLIAAPKRLEYILL